MLIKEKQVVYGRDGWNAAGSQGPGVCRKMDGVGAQLLGQARDGNLLPQHEIGIGQAVPAYGLQLWQAGWINAVRYGNHNVKVRAGGPQGAAEFYDVTTETVRLLVEEPVNQDPWHQLCLLADPGFVRTCVRACHCRRYDCVANGGFVELFVRGGCQTISAVRVALVSDTLAGRLICLRMRQASRIMGRPAGVQASAATNDP